MERKQRKKQKQLSHIRQVLPELLGNLRGSDDRDLMRLWDIWPEAVGAPVAQNTRPAAFRGKILIVEVNSSVWMHQLQFVKADMKDRINQTLGAHLVDELKFKVGAF